MDITKLRNNDQYYRDYIEDCEPEYIMRFKNNHEFNIHIWQGYLDDIFDTCKLGVDWQGFTKDFQEFVRTCGDIGFTKINIDEYLNDIRSYLSKTFRFKETMECLLLIIDFLEYGKETNSEIEAKLDQ